MTKLKYNAFSSLAENVERLPQSKNELAKECEVSANTLTKYLHKFNRQNQLRDDEIDIMNHISKIILNKFVYVPKQAHKIKRYENWKIFGCKDCKYSTIDTNICIKFSISKNDINSGYEVHLLNNKPYSFRLNVCPYSPTRG